MSPMQPKASTGVSGFVGQKDRVHPDPMPAFTGVLFPIKKSCISISPTCSRFTMLTSPWLLSLPFFLLPIPPVLRSPLSEQARADGSTKPSAASASRAPRHRTGRPAPEEGRRRMAEGVRPPECGAECGRSERAGSRQPGKEEKPPDLPDPQPNSFQGAADFTSITFIHPPEAGVLPERGWHRHRAMPSPRGAHPGNGVSPSPAASSGHLFPASSQPSGAAQHHRLMLPLLLTRKHRSFTFTVFILITL